MFSMLGGASDFSLLDLGCGPGFSLGYLQDRFGSMECRYLGVDISAYLVELAQKEWPRHNFIVRDVIADPLPTLAYDYTVLCGVLTGKMDLTFEAMEEFAQSLLSSAWNSTRIAMSFNVMSSHVDWTRDELFHWPIDSAVAFSVSRLSRHINIISDYGLYEYTVQIYREPRRQEAVPPAWKHIL